jgi:acetolactate synthase regulatory subunit
MAAVMLGVCATHADNKINGITVCPKRGFNIIKLWNGDAQRFHHPSNLNLAVGSARESEIIYTQFLEKKM